MYSLPSVFGMLIEMVTACELPDFQLPGSASTSCPKRAVD